MKYPIFASFIIFCAWLTYELKKSSRKNSKINDDFWETEAKANNTRKKTLDNLTYVCIPENILHLTVADEDEDIKECYETLLSLSSEKIVNLTGYTNTELKLKYGAPNIDVLIQYDQNYTSLVKTLQKLGDKLLKKGFEKEAIELLEFSVATRTDISSTYRLLMNYYLKQQDKKGLNQLLITAKGLNSAMKTPIVRMLQEAGQ